MEQVFKGSSMSHFWLSHASELATCSWKTSPSKNCLNFNVLPCFISSVSASKLCSLRKARTSQYRYWPEYNFILCFIWATKENAFQSSYFSQICPELFAKSGWETLTCPSRARHKICNVLCQINFQKSVRCDYHSVITEWSLVFCDGCSSKQ